MGIDKALMIGEKEKLKYIVKGNRLIQSKYPLTAMELKFTYTIMELIQNSLRNMYSKNFKEKYDETYFIFDKNNNKMDDEENKINDSHENEAIQNINGQNSKGNMLDQLDTIKINTNLSCDNKILVERIKLKDDNVWNIKINYSCEDFYEDFKEFSNVSRLNKETFKKLIESVSNKGIYLINEDANDYIFTHWYKIKGKIDNFYENIELIMDYDIADFIITKGFYTKLSRSVLSNLKGIYALRQYELISQWDNSKGDPIYKLDYLRTALNADNVYKNIAAFEINVIKKGIDEINSVSPVKYDYEILKKGRKSVGVRYYKIDLVAKDEDIKDFELFIYSFNKISTVELSKTIKRKFHDDFKNYDIYSTYKDVLIFAIEKASIYIKQFEKLKYKTINAKIYPYFKKRLVEGINAYEMSITEANNATITNNACEETNASKIKENIEPSLESNDNKEFKSVDNNLNAKSNKVDKKKNEGSSLINEQIDKLLTYFSKDIGLSEVSFNTWIKDTECIIGENNTLIVKALNSFSMDIIEKRYMKIFQNISKELGLNHVKVIMKETE